MHHKRKRPKNRRAGCLLCKPWKANGAKRVKTNRPRVLRRADEAARHSVVMVLLSAFVFAACSRDQQSEHTATDALNQAPQLLAGVDLQQPLRALGTEPFWSVEITPDSLVYTAVDSPEQRAANPGAMVRDSVAVYAGIFDNATPIIVTLTTTECSDGMSDRRYPLHASVKLGNTTLQGCAASQAFLDTAPAP